MDSRASLTSRPARLVADLRRGLLRRRRPLAAALAAVAALAAMQAVAPPPVRTVEVAVAAHDLPTGRTLRAADLRTESVPADAAPPGRLDHPAGAVGAVLAGPIAAGEVVTRTRVVGPGRAAAPGTVLAPVRLTDADAAALLSPGDCIDLVATDAATATSSVAGRDLRVVAIPEPVAGLDSGGTGALLVAAVPASGLAAGTAASVAGYVTYAWCDR